MNPLTPTPFDIIAWLVAALTVLFGASASCVRCLAAMRGRARRGFARLAQRWTQRGYAMAYDGEDDATVARRIARMEWMAADPWKALRHLARRARGLLRVRLCAMSAPLSFAPPVIACAPCSAGLQTGPVVAMEPP